MRWPPIASLVSLLAVTACLGDGAPRIQGVSGGDGGGGGTGGPATHLAFLAAPASASAGVTLDAVQVAAEDGAGATDPTFTGLVSIGLGANPTGATLSGTLTVNAVSGVATFSDLRIDLPGNGYKLAASAGGLGAGASAGFNVQ
jgi:hypothetical protein